MEKSPILIPLLGIALTYLGFGPLLNRNDNSNPWAGETMQGLKFYFWCVVFLTLIAFIFGLWLWVGLNSAN